MEKDPALIFNDVFNSDAIELTKAKSNRAFEDKIVKKILTNANLAHHIPTLVKETKDRTGDYKLTLGIFYEYYPEFPVWLVTKKIPYVHQITVPELFNKFQSSKICTAWDDAHAESPCPEKATCLIFDWAGIKGTQMVLHNNHAVLDLPAVRLSRKIGRGETAQLIYLEQFEPFFDHIFPKWTR